MVVPFQIDVREGKKGSYYQWTIYYPKNPIYTQATDNREKHQERVHFHLSSDHFGLDDIFDAE